MRFFCVKLYCKRVAFLPVFVGLRIFAAKSNLIFGTDIEYFRRCNFEAFCERPIVLPIICDQPPPSYQKRASCGSTSVLFSILFKSLLDSLGDNIQTRGEWFNCYLIIKVWTDSYGGYLFKEDRFLCTVSTFDLCKTETQGEKSL